jgi:hypothetical protein
VLLGACVVNCCTIISAGSSRETSGARTANNGPHLRPARRWRKSAGWIVPGTILALLPKCPACIVAYFALAGGIGISLTTATYLRMALVVLCIGSLVYFVARLARRKILSSPPRPSLELNPFKTLRKYFSRNVTVTHLNVI